MESVTVTREVAAPPDAVRAVIADVGPFMRAAKFDAVEVEGDRVHIENTVGLFLTVELDLELVDRPDAVLAYEQRDGIFESMETVYRVEGDADGSTVTATTEFALDASFVGPLLDATVVTRQRRAELTSQFDYLEAQVTDGYGLS